jgi:uncharacterized protein
MTVEYRAFFGDDAEVRAASEGMSFTGYAIRYNAKSEPLPFRETIAPGAVTRSLRSRNEIKAFVNHDTNLVIGSTRAGTLRLTDDERGVLADIDLPDVTYARDLAENVRVGNVSGMSFGFSVVKDKWSEDYSERTIHELRLHEVSVVTGFPAYRQTTAAVRAMTMLAKRTGVDIDALSDAFDALSEGSLNDDQYALLVDAADRARPEQPAPAPEPVDLSALQALSDLLKKRDDL